MQILKIKKLHPDAILPRRATEGSAGYDLSACISAPLTVFPGQTTRIPTGIAIQLDPGYAALIFGRSGLGIKHGVVPANAVGVVDSDYRGELIVGLTCLHQTPYEIQPGERIAQMLILPAALPTLLEVDTLDESARGQSGFGSTGKQ